MLLVILKFNIYGDSREKPGPTINGVLPNFKVAYVFHELMIKEPNETDMLAILKAPRLILLSGKVDY